MKRLALLLALAVAGCATPVEEWMEKWCEQYAEIPVIHKETGKKRKVKAYVCMKLEPEESI